MGHHSSERPLGTMMKQHAMIAAEVCGIVICLRYVVEKWILLYQDLSELLAQDFMQPKDFVNLLFDDENFTRSHNLFLGHRVPQRIHS